MLWLLIAPLWIALLIGLIWVFLRAKNLAGRYEAIFDQAHLIEFAECVRRIRSGALQNEGIVQTPGFPENAVDDLPPGAARTSAGLVLFYSVDHEDGGWQHHFSMSWQGGFFAESTARFLFAYLHHLLELEGTEVALGLSEGGRYHMAWQLDDEAQAVFKHRDVVVPVSEDVQDVLQQCWHTAEQVRIARMSGPVRGGGTVLG